MNKDHDPEEDAIRAMRVEWYSWLAAERRPLTTENEPLKEPVPPDVYKRRGRPAKVVPFKGVSVDVGGKWRAEIQAGGNRVFLGSFQQAASAAIAYDVAARLFWPDRDGLKVNFPAKGERQA